MSRTTPATAAARVGDAYAPGLLEVAVQMREDMNQPSYEVITEFDVEAPMRDGVILRANVFTPRGDGPFPVILSRTCYMKDGLAEAPYHGFDPVQVARYGFIVAVQDVRGRYCSDGEWVPMKNEREDGYDSVEWAAKLPNSNGRVGMYGGSYVGSTQWSAAVAGAPSLKAIAPMFTWNRGTDGMLTRGGALEIGLPAFWALMQGFDYLARTLSEDEQVERFEALANEYDELGTKGYWELPAADLPSAARHGLPTAWFSPEVSVEATYTDGEFDAIAPDLANFNTAGWYDLLLQGSLDNYIAAKKRGLDSRLIVGPWTHEGIADPVGEKYFGLRSYRETFMVDYSESWLGRHLAWFAKHLGPVDEIELPEKPVRIFVMGRNEWRDEDGWPLERARDERWYLRADGTVTPEGPDAAAATTGFTYDPADPVPALGGNSTWVQGYPQGPINQEKVERREDVLVFTSAPLTEDLEVTGPVRAKLSVQSSASSTDWVVRLCDVDPDGASINICDGILRVPAGADSLSTVEVDMWSTSNVFLTGHQIRIQVTSSSFPRWDRNLNTGDQNGPRIEVAEQQLHHGGDQLACWVDLPVVRD